MQELLSEMRALRAANETLRRERDEMRPVYEAAVALIAASETSDLVDDEWQVLEDAVGVEVRRAALSAKEE